MLKTLAQDSSVPMADDARLAQRVSASYLAEGRDKDAYALASGFADQSHNIEPLLDWSAGFAAFRLADYEHSGSHFARLARMGSVPSWTRAAAAFWAARAYMQAGEPRQVIALLTAAAREEPTFYGLLAERVLGQQPDSAFQKPALTVDSFNALMRVAPAHRAVALWQVGEKDAVPNEMNRAFAAIHGADGPAFAALAKDMVMPNLELRASEIEASRGVMLTGLFPVPKYSPDGGYTVDPSVVLAIARVESRFEANAISGVGARGLMQLMPGTARHVAGRQMSDDELRDPAINLSLGQRYLDELLKQVNGNLYELAAAYNAGPANLSRWLTQRAGKHDDPLLFVESVPSPETRSYIKRFMMYHWLYRRRLDQDSPTLDQAAAGGWPLYQPQNVPVASIPAALQAYDAAAN
jgi:soluble lytic murein transglycosylase-like protein